MSRWLAVFELDSRVIAALRAEQIEMRTARALLPLRGDAKAQRAILARIKREKLDAGQVAAIVAAREHPHAIEPLRHDVAGVGRVDARTTRTGKLRVVLEATDHAGLAKLWRWWRKQM